MDLWIKGKKFTHPINVINELNQNISGIDFIRTHKLTYDVLSRQVKLAGFYSNTIAALIQTILPAMTSLVVNIKYKGKADPKATYVTNILCTKDTYGLRNVFNCVHR